MSMPVNFPVTKTVFLYATLFTQVVNPLSTKHLETSTTQPTPYHLVSCLEEPRNYCSLTGKHEINDCSVTRRSFGLGLLPPLITAGAGTAVLSCFPTRVVALTTKEEELAKEKILKGYQRLNYLLDNWVSETTVCGRGDNPYVTGKGCERTPLKVMEYLGYRDINDPLFRADKTLKKLEPLIPNDRFVDFLEAVEKWTEAAEEGSGTAYISSWGEANPGGGRDRVELFIERARKNVIDSRDSLAVVVDILNLKQL